jgi:hypothetical protein
MNIELHEQLALALSECFSERDSTNLRRFLETTSHGKELNAESDEVLRAAAVLMGTFPERTRKLVGMLELERERARKNNVFTATRLRQLGRYGFRLVYVGNDDPQAAFEKYRRDNLDCLSEDELVRLRDSLTTARVTTIADINN